MATRNRTSQFSKYRDTLNCNRVPVTSSSAFGGPVIEMAPLFHRSNGSSYAPLSTEDPGPSRGWVGGFMCSVSDQRHYVTAPAEAQEGTRDEAETGWQHGEAEVTAIPARARVKIKFKKKTVTPLETTSLGDDIRVTGNDELFLSPDPVGIVRAACLTKPQEYLKGRQSTLYCFCSRDAFTVGLPPDWVDVSEEVAASIQRVRIKMAELVKAHAKALTPSFGDGREDQRMIEALTQEITVLLRRSEKSLQKLSAGGPSEDSNIRKNVQPLFLAAVADDRTVSGEERQLCDSGSEPARQDPDRSLATDLQNLSVELRKKQSTYLRHLRQQKEGHDGLDLEMNLNESKHRVEDEEFTEQGFNEHQMATLKKSELFAAEREREIRQVLQSVNEIAQIMKDLSVLVIDQGTILDRIDYNVQNVASSVEEGFKELKKVYFLSLALCHHHSRENSEERGNGDLCNGAHYHVLRHASPPDPQGNTVLI
ncbi:hypothetical protein RJ639_046912 [Escallonia herrerae]|uniref:t-SNARE coiled-coil homology domain-containing protein n=1 Tax=Escallonia herrerae TaxID=1293975 RepID=A0AA88W458_9ASTE|nr:hypothetical protein RJ639_046912 [Escallonia herrerae]